jgi:hypothetical protein
MTEWFRERGWKVSLSGPGRIAKQLLKQLGGQYGISRIAHKGVIELLGELEKEAGLPHQAVIQKLKGVIQTGGLFFEADRFLESLLSANALRLGTKIQCNVCTRYNWYELNALNYELRCRFCLSDFSPPLESPKNIKWTYRAHGPFAASIAQGAFTVLLTLKQMGVDLHQAITPLFSYNAEKDGKNLEADLTFLYKTSSWRDTCTYVVHAECKSFNRFERRDIKRMKELAGAFPGSALIFATLNSALVESEAKLIRALAVSERKKRFRLKPSSPVILLTGTELFSRNISANWKNKGGLHEKFSQWRLDLSNLSNLADVTQQLYLDLPSWSDWAAPEREKLRQKRARKKAEGKERSSTSKR